MEICAQFPTRTIGNDPAKIKDWAQAAEDLGYSYIEVPDHVFGASPRNGWTPTYAADEDFHETFVTIGFLAACTNTIRLSSGVLILPQRQTGVVAKQAAEADLPSGGRLRLGIGVGWNHVEYEALEADWHTRGRKQAEQVEVLRMLWSEELVSFKGEFHDFSEINIMPGPAQKPIPIWFGGSADAVIKRAARIGDGWMPIMPPNEKAVECVAKLNGWLNEFEREKSKFGIETWLRADAFDPDKWSQTADAWAKLGAQMAMLYPMYPLLTFEDHIIALEAFKGAVGD